MPNIIQDVALQRVPNERGVLGHSRLNVSSKPQKKLSEECGHSIPQTLGEISKIDDDARYMS